MSIRKIAAIIGVAPSSVSRELRRNCTDRGHYNPKQAHLFAGERHEWKHHPRKMNKRIKQEITDLIREHQWSPEQIAGRYKREGKPMVGKTSIYNFLHEDKRQGGSLYTYCRHALKYRRARLSVPVTSKKPRRSILGRPACIDHQERRGDFEPDLIIVATPNEAILTLTDRKTNFAIIQALPEGRKAKPIAKILVKKLAFLKRRGQLHSITTDNGSEFMAFDKIEKALKVPVYFARPYTSTDKPHIEHLNALIRQYIPKASSFIHITPKKLSDIQKNSTIDQERNSNIEPLSSASC
ncbi:IS30 family transposase [Porphyromonas gulae]|uniref:IS30 family transposase n=1 Tax=Porphyromonas gulae TaxID=111105 RepID=UPI00190F5C44|nr:IS30 family transposase [Porphyromonas gulae]